MPQWLQIVLLTTAAGICMPIGGLLARAEWLVPRWLDRELRHIVIAFGGGILLGAVTVVLVPEGRSGVGGSVLPVLVILAGGVAFFLVERVLGRRKRESPQLTGMLLDFVPEAIALGGLVASGSRVAPLMALLIALQNVPEGFACHSRGTKLNR